MLILDSISRPVPLSDRKIAYLNESLKILCRKSLLDEAEKKAKENSCSKRSYRLRKDSDAKFHESDSDSLSPLESSRTRLRDMPRSREKQEEKCDEISKVKEERFSPYQLTEEESVRRRSLRSWKDHSSLMNEANTPLESSKQTEHRNHSNNVQQTCSQTSDQDHCLTCSASRETSGYEMEMNKVSIEGLANPTVASFEHSSSISNADKRISMRRRSEAKKITEMPCLSLHKLRRTAAETTSTEVAFLKSLYITDLNIDYKQRLRRYTVDKNDEMNEFKVLRPRYSLPSMIQGDHSSAETLTESKIGTMIRFRSKRGSDRRGGIRRPRAFGTH